MKWKKSIFLTIQNGMRWIVKWCGLNNLRVLILTTFSLRITRHRLQAVTSPQQLELHENPTMSKIQLPLAFRNDCRLYQILKQYLDSCKGEKPDFFQHYCHVAS